MTVNTFTQPDNSAQTGNPYKTNIDEAIAALARVARRFAPHENLDSAGASSPDLTVTLDAGYIDAIAGLATEVAEQTTGALSAPSSNPRNDIIYVDATSGTVGVATGSEAASPSDPAVPAGKVAVARINWTVGMAEITNADLDDLRNPGMFNVGTSNGNLVRLENVNGNPGFPAVDGSQLTGIVSGATAEDMRLAFLLVAENAGDRVNMVDGIADPFADETDVDTVTSTNESYDASGDFYAPTTTTGSDQTGSGTAISSGDGAGEGKENAFDDDTGTTWATANNAVNGDYIGYDFGAGNDVEIREITISTHSSMTAGNWSGDVNIQYSDNGSDWTTAVNATPAYPGTSSSVDIAVTASGAHRYWRVENNDGALGARWRLAEIAMKDASIDNMTLVSNAFTADSAPDTGRIHVQVQENESITENTDLIAKITREGNDSVPTYATATLTQVETLADGTVSYEDGSVDLSGQSSDTAMRWRVETANNKDIEVHGIVLQWD